MSVVSLLSVFLVEYFDVSKSFFNDKVKPPVEEQRFPQSYGAMFLLKYPFSLMSIFSRTDTQRPSVPDKRDFITTFYAKPNNSLFAYCLFIVLLDKIICMAYHDPAL